MSSFVPYVRTRQNRTRTFCDNILTTKQKMKLGIDADEREERQTKLVKRCPTILALPAPLRDAVLGDFMQHKHPYKKMLTVAKSFKAALRLQAAGFVDGRLLSIFETNADKPLAEMHKMFKERLAVTDARRQVFGTLWQLVAVYLTPSDLENWRYACDFAPKEDLQFFLEKNDSIRRVWATLRQMPDIATINFRESPVYARIWAYVRAYPTYPGHSPAVLAPAIAAFARETQQMTPEVITARTTHLRTQLEALGLQLRQDSRFATAYIHGTQYCTVEEVAATLKMSGAMFAVSHVFWSHGHVRFESLLAQKVFTENRPWIEVALEIIASAEFRQAGLHALVAAEDRYESRYRRRYDSDYEDDYY